MDIQTAGALSLYTYRTNLRQVGPASSGSGGSSSPAGAAQDSAILQALTSTYTGVRSGGSDTMASLVGSGVLPSLVAGIYAQSVASTAPAAASPPVLGVTESPTSTTTSSLLTAMGGGLEGFAPAANLDATLALKTYQQNSATPTTPVTDPNTPANIHKAILAAQTNAYQSTFSLLG